MSRHHQELRQGIARWLAFSSRVEVPLGVSRAAVAARAEQLLTSLSDERFATGTPVQEDAKDVVWAVVRGAAGSKPNIADLERISRFVRRLNWRGDHFGERNMLLSEIASLGWQYRGITPRLAALMRMENVGDRSVELDRYLATTLSSRSDEQRRAYFCSTEAAFALCERLRRTRDVTPAHAIAEAADAFSFLHGIDGFGSLDDLELILTDLAITAAGASRYLCRLDAADSWLSAAAQMAAAVCDPRPLLARVRYTRLTVLHRRGCDSETLTEFPALAREFEQLGMESDSIKTRLFGAKVLKLRGDVRRALDIDLELMDVTDSARHATLCPWVVVELFDCLTVSGEYSRALDLYRQYLPLVQRAGIPMLSADVFLTLGSLLRNTGRLAPAIEAFRTAKQAFASAGESSFEAYASVLLAETLLKQTGSPELAYSELRHALHSAVKDEAPHTRTAALALLAEIQRRRQERASRLAVLGADDRARPQ